MNTSDFHYSLDESLIAQTPAERRDGSRLLVYERSTKKTAHLLFCDIVSYLRCGDVLVLNDTKVIPARLFGRKNGSGRVFEVFLLRRLSVTDWEALLRPGKKLAVGDSVLFSDQLKAIVQAKKQDGVAIVRFCFDGVFEQLLDELGETPLPPYIHEQLEDKARYQTVYAKKDGSAAAPTAGLHFTPDLLKAIENKGVRIARLTLHVGLGTFRPVKAKYIKDHIMHAEYFEISGETAQAINDARSKGGRIMAVGTTSVRTLETVSDKNGVLRAANGRTDIFIAPGYKFLATDALLTNFHLPESTLIMLVSAFAGHKETLKLYKTAAELRYRFFSFGDAMLIL